MVAGFGLFMVLLDVTIVNVALPATQKDFEAGEAVAFDPHAAEAAE